MEGARARYGPAAPLIDFLQLLDEGRPFVFVGKPCDVAAVRNLARIDDRVSKSVPYLLSMVCGGASELGLSLEVLSEFGLREEDISSFRYRGFGNPGPTYIETLDGRTFEKTYNEMWEQGESTWRLQFRCKICPDAIGEQADIVALDTWPGAHPTGDDEGFNAVIARTPAGLKLQTRQRRRTCSPCSDRSTFAKLDSFQPHQVERRRAELARLTAFALGIGVRPSFKGHRLFRAALAAGIRGNIANFVGTGRRLRARQHLDLFVQRLNGASSRQSRRRLASSVAVSFAVQACTPDAHLGRQSGVFARSDRVGLRRRRPSEGDVDSAQPRSAETCAGLHPTDMALRIRRPSHLAVARWRWTAAEIGVTEGRRRRGAGR